jgi:hypothetical protein
METLTPKQVLAVLDLITPEEIAFVLYVDNLWDAGEPVPNKELRRLLRLAVKFGLGDYPLDVLADIVAFTCREVVHKYGWEVVHKYGGAPDDLS